MKTIDQIIADVIKAEGGYVNDPKDRGGATKYGISLRFARGLGLLLDKDGDGDVDADDIKALTPDDARRLYFEYFVVEPGFVHVNENLRPQLVDFGVLSGPPRAIMTLQRTLVRQFGEKLDDDGRLGPNTRTVTEAVCRSLGWKRLNNGLVDARKAFLRSLVHQDPDQERFINGWLTRAESFRVPA